MTYWDYMQLEKLFTLQSPITDRKDERNFIVFHQLTELGFSLVIHELSQITVQNEPSTEARFLKGLNRAINYFKMLTNIFGTMVKSIDREEFIEFRSNLVPSSGFQSVQFRKIELLSTGLKNLLPISYREVYGQQSIPKMFEKIYWIVGATDQATSKKTAGLEDFEAKYLKSLVDLAFECEERNLEAIYNKHFSDSKNQSEIQNTLREFDVAANINWRYAHLRLSGQFLKETSKEIVTTGGTDWKKYLPPHIQRIQFFPSLWTAEETARWSNDIKV